MNLKKVIIELEPSQVQEILRIDMDEDAGAALAFIKEKPANHMKASLQPH